MNQEQGNITLFFCMFCLILIGAISYSLYVGQMVSDRIAEQNAADSSALAMAGHAAQGLNMISANNLSIGASIQVASSISTVALYLGTVRALFFQKSDWGTLAEGKSPAQKDVYDNMMNITYPFMQAAGGMAFHNRQLYNFWLFGAPVRGVEVGRMNFPGSLVVPVQRSMLKAGNKMNSAFQYQGLRATSPGSTVCHTMRAIGDGDTLGLGSLGQWVLGPVSSMHGSLADGISGIFNLVEDIQGKFSGGVGGFLQLNPPGFGFNQEHCSLSLQFSVDFGIENDSWIFAFLGDPFPGGGVELFSIDEPIQNVAKQAQHFGKAHQVDSDDVEGSLGFLFPVAQGKSSQGSHSDPYSTFKDSVEFASVVINPIRSFDQLNPKNCPDDWKRDGKCDFHGLVGIVGGNGEKVAAYNTDPKKVEQDFNLLSGGLQSQFGAQGDMQDTFSRLKVRIGQARAAYRPNDHDPAETQKNLDRPSVQLFWPAWRAEPVRGSLLADILVKLGLAESANPGIWSLVAF